MPRVLTRQQLESRQARLSDGSPVRKIELVNPVVEETPLVAPPTIDATPIAEAVDRMTGSINESLMIQRLVIEKLTESKKEPVVESGAWEFTVKRDSKGRMESVVARMVP